MSRIQEIAPAAMSPEQREVYEMIVARGGRLGGPHTAYLRIPRFMRLAQDMGDYLRRNSLDDRMRQMIVLRVLRHWEPKFAWAMHVPASLKMGVEQEIVDAITERRAPKVGSPKDRAALAVAGELVETGKVADATYQEALAQFGEAGLADVVATVGFYTMVSFTLNAFDIDAPGK